MTLGSILDSDQGAPIAGRPVTFHLTIKKPGQPPRQVEVKAYLYPVSETDRRLAKEAARKFLLEDPASPYRVRVPQEGVAPAPPVTTEALYEEFALQFLRFALHDADGLRLIGADDYGRFRQGLVRQSIEQLDWEYDALIASEYPEVMSEERRKAEMAKLVGEAAGK